jgi:hypothetical protein
VAKVPENYEDRLSEIFPRVFKHLRLLGLDPYDLALSKRERNIQRDRDAVKHLAKTVPFDLEVLKRRYQKELRWVGDSNPLSPTNLFKHLNYTSGFSSTSMMSKL